MAARRRFVHLGINPQNIPWGTVSQLVENYLDAVAGDWYRYAAQNYVVWIDADLATLSKSIAELPGLQSIYLLATEFDPNEPHTNGWMPKQFWEWLHKPRIPAITPPSPLPPGLFPPFTKKQ